MGLDRSSLLPAALTGHSNCRVYARLCLAKIRSVDLDRRELRERFRTAYAIGKPTQSPKLVFGATLEQPKKDFKLISATKATT
jgi:hypothetical protein